MSDFTDKDRKEFRRKKLKNNFNKNKQDYSDEDRASKNKKKELREKLYQMEEEEIWDEWGFSK